MAKVQSGETATGASSRTGASNESSDVPPQIPPRMKKKGPALPEKPPHMRAKSVLSSHPPAVREPLKPRVLPSNIDARQPQREVLVAASRALREKPVEKRQREPAKLLMPTFADGRGIRKDVLILPSRKTSVADEGCRRDVTVLTRKDTLPNKEDRLVFPAKTVDSSRNGKSRPPGPLLLIPRGPAWGPGPVSFALWPQRDPNKGGRGEAVQPRARSGSVTRSGSLTSQGSGSSDSGSETFPKSVLKKQKRSTASRCPGHVKKRENKKNVTFNAFATVQLMEE